MALDRSHSTALERPNRRCWSEPMATVHFTSDLARYTGGLETVALDAHRIHELKQSLARRFPGLGEQLDTMAVAIDGEIYNDADYQRLEADTEVHFVPRMAGG
jgi:molybdopterin converting factor small subunit